MADELEYVVKDALMMCDKGAAPGFFMPTHNMHINVSNCLVTNKMDMLPIANIPTFGLCSVSQCACVPVPTMWQKTYPVKVKSQETLLCRSCMQCGLGGKIEFVTSGQIPLPPDALDDIKAMQEAGQEEEEGWGWLDTVELIPVVGSIVGAVREGIKGNWGMMALNIGFLAMDIAGVVSFGGTTVAATAAKTAIKAGTKVVAKTAAKAIGKTGLKTGTKLFAKNAAKAFKGKIADIILIASKGVKCVLACFPEGTLIHTEQGIRPIEDIKIGDKVWSYDEKSGEIGLKKVVQTIEQEVDATIRIQLGTEEIETTAEHPFFADNQWKDAAYLKSGDKLTNIKKETSEISAVDFYYNSKKVYNFEVADWHTYFVGLLGWLVHNARPCLKKLLDPRTPAWLKRIMKGNYFNFIRESYYTRKGGFNEVVLKGLKRLDSYIPGKEIVSRKFTQLGNNINRGKKYIDELAKKYSPGTKIKNTERNAEAIKQGGDKLSGEMILEIPPQKKPIDPKILKHADDKKVIIRDTNGKIYN